MNQNNAHHPAWRWGTGFRNLFRQENKKWWRTSRWIKYTLIWVLLANSIPLIIYLDGGAVSAEETLLLYVIMSMMALIIGVIVVMQGVIIGEKQSGATAWLLSKPVARSAYLLSRLSATGLATLFTMLVFPTLVAYEVMTQLSGHVVDVGAFALAMGLAALFMLFLLTLTLMLGVLFNGRAVVIGIPITLLMFSEFYEGLLARYAPGLLNFDPMYLLEIANNVALGKPLSSFTPLISTAIWSLLLMAIAIWRFNREEF
jgi:ABC-type transport system involved in multi-copper enzyme maturation permease subunit